jgi:NAD(P)-dependent dehydrogenase (short-subunit alcohol dehydrogenase family)
MDLQLKGKNAVVTGSSAGIGWAIALELALEGANVVINGRDEARLKQAAHHIQEKAREVKIGYSTADLSSAGGCAQLTEAYPECDILVNNLGIFDPRPFEQISDAEWYRFYDVNVMSGVRLARHYLPKMKEKNWGRMIFISSESGIGPPGDMVHYGMTKSAQLSVSRALAETCAGTQVTVNAVLPGPTKTEGVVTLFNRLAAEGGLSVAQMEKDFFAHGRPTSILKRFIEPGEVASMVAYLCSPRAAATNGAALRVEGGIVRTIV